MAGRCLTRAPGRSSCPEDIAARPFYLPELHRPRILQHRRRLRDRGRAPCRPSPRRAAARRLMAARRTRAQLRRTDRTAGTLRPLVLTTLGIDSRVGPLTVAAIADTRERADSFRTASPRSPSLKRSGQNDAGSVPPTLHLRYRNARPLTIASFPNRARIASVARSARSRMPASGQADHPPVRLGPSHKSDQPHAKQTERTPLLAASNRPRATRYNRSAICVAPTSVSRRDTIGGSDVSASGQQHAPPAPAPWRATPPFRPSARYGRQGCPRPPYRHETSSHWKSS